MNVSRILRFALGAVLAPVCICLGDALTDGEIRQVIVRFLAPRCGGGHAGENDLSDPELADIVALNGDTNRLARILAEIAQTNNAWYSEMAMWELEKYGTAEQLPFLYSCATNPAIGDKAVKAVLRIEGVTSNTVAALDAYLSSTNSVTYDEAYRRAISSRDFLSVVREGTVEQSELRNAALQVVRTFASNVNTSNRIVDEALMDTDATYQFSKRRLGVMRAAYPRCFNEYQTNYVANAISELVAYPEADLPD